MENILLITTGKYNLPGVKQSKTFVNIDLTEYTCVVFNSSTDAEIEIIQRLKEAKTLDLKIIYVNQKIIPLFFWILTSLDADIYEQEEYLVDLGSLTYIVTDYKNTGVALKTPDEEMVRLSKIVSTLVDNPMDTLKQLSTNNYWMSTLTTSVASVEMALSYSYETNEKAVSMLEASYDLVQQLREGQEKTTHEMEKLKQLINEHDKRSTRTSTTFLFGTYQVPVHIPKVLYIKSYGHCRYLNSFLLAYQDYLLNSKQTPSRILFAFPKLKDLTQKYSSMGFRLANESLGLVEDTTKVFKTFEPKKDIMDKFFSLPSKVFIVVDLMYDEPIISGNVDKLYAVNSVSEIDTFNIPVKDTIMSITSLPEAIKINHIKDYLSQSETVRKRLYFRNNTVAFEKLDKIVLDGGR